MRRPTHPFANFLFACGLLGSFVALALLTSEPAWTDDTDLVRENTAKPYVYFLLDTSSSMNLELDTNNWLEGSGDDERSKIYQAKRALYEVFQDVDDIHFGMGTFNQDELHIQAKHWLYFHTSTLPGGWPLNYPLAGAVQRDADGNLTGLSGDFQTVGRHLNDTGEGGSCSAPLDLSKAIDRAKANRFAKLGITGTETTKIWVEDGGTVFQLLVTAPDIVAGTQKLGDPTVRIRFELRKRINCSGPELDLPLTADLDFFLHTEFLMWDDGSGLFQGPTSGGEGRSQSESTAGFWDWQDPENTAVCTEGGPFTGKGWEGNYDDPEFVQIVSGGTTEDEFCTTAGGSPDPLCRNLKHKSFTDSQFPEFRELDRGDMIPFHWKISGKDEFLRRLNANHGVGFPDYRSSPFFTDQPDSLGVLALKNSGQRPLVADGESPLAKSINDFRCWFMGPNTEPAGKCPSNTPFTRGWLEVAKDLDPEFICRRPFLIIISDGENTCTGGENPQGDVSDMKTTAKVRTWVFNLGGATGERKLKDLFTTGEGELITVTTGDQLKEELINILGIIREEARAFASAAVPSVQAEVADKIFLTRFTPLNNQSIWDGEVHAFLKPLPLDDQNRPDFNHENHLWDAGEVMKTQVNDTNPLGAGENQRRVYYPLAPAEENVPRPRRLFNPTSDTLPDATRYDLWKGLGLISEETPVGSLSDDEEALLDQKTAAITKRTFELKTHTFQDGSTTEYILGDIFHSNPLIIGNPSNSLFFAQDLQGYRDFFRKHQTRRKMLLAGANDGMLHFFDAGIFEGEGADPGDFNNGSGKEIAAMIPRPVLPTIRVLAEGNSHQWSVDGSVSVADLFIDPVHNGTPVAADREWRTVLVAGLREGGDIYYALDITQPDRLTVTERDSAGNPIAFKPTTDVVPSCHNVTGTGTEGDCHSELRFPETLWEFDDSVRLSDGSRVRLDEDDIGGPDLGFTWSIPNLGRIRLVENGELVDKYVAIFGGGLDPDNPDIRGNWLYIVDVETGKALYKRRLNGSAPSEPAAVDTNRDGYLDRIYIGTTRGFIHRVDLRPEDSGNFPALQEVTLVVNGENVTVQRIVSEAWEPRIIFDNIHFTTGKRLPLFFRPSVFFVARLGLFGLAFGEGDREDLWSKTSPAQPGRFYVFVDDTDQLAPGTVITSADLVPISASDPDVENADFLLERPTGQRGWVLELDVDERTVTNAFALSGVTFFSTFQPEVGPGELPDTCAKTGTSRIFSVFTNNANGVLFSGGERTRFITASTLVTEAFTEQGPTKNPTSSGEGATKTADELTADLEQIMNELKKLFPQNCKFANYRIDIKTIEADTGVIFIAPVPICIVEKNWREF